MCFMWNLHRVSTVSALYFARGPHRVCTVLYNVFMGSAQGAHSVHTVPTQCFVWGPHSVLYEVHT